MTLVVIGSGAAYLIEHPQLVNAWWADVWAGNWKPGADPEALRRLGASLGRAFRCSRRSAWA